MGHEPRRSGCLGCITVLALITAIAVAAILYLAPPVTANVLRGVGRQLYNGAQSLLHLEEDGGDAAATAVSTGAIGFAGSQLDEQMQSAYAQLYDGIVGLQDTIAVYGAESDDIDPAFRAIMRDHPELFWIDGSCRYTYSQIGDVVTVMPGLSTPLADVPAVRQSLEEVSDAFLASLPADASQYDIARSAYEYVIMTTDYQLDASQSQNIISVLLNHASVCAGYARAYQYLLQRAGMFCTYVEGTITNPAEDHAWCLVQIDGAYAYVDPTWGDPTYLGDVEGISDDGIIYDYLCLTTVELERDGHTLASPESMPVCDAPELDYYRRQGRYYDTYDSQALLNAFWETVNGGGRTLAFKLGSDEALAAVAQDLANGTFLAGDFSLVASSYRYTTSDSLRVVKVFW